MLKYANQLAVFEDFKETKKSSFDQQILYYQRLGTNSERSTYERRQGWNQREEEITQSLKCRRKFVTDQKGKLYKEFNYHVQSLLLLHQLGFTTEDVNRILNYIK